MLSYEQLVEKSKELNNKINENLEQRKILQTKELMHQSNADYQRHAYARKLREKLNLVISSRNKANESNRRLLSDFDRIQKHLAMMDNKTEILMSKVENQKQYLNIHYPKWRERANMFTSPSYLNQENMFNLLDSLRCRLSNDDNTTFRTFPKTEFNLDRNQSLVSLLRSKDDMKNRSTETDVIPETQHVREDSRELLDTPQYTSQHFINNPNNDLCEDVISSSERERKQEPTIDTLTNITVSPDVSLKRPEYDGDASEQTISPPRIFKTSLSSPEPDPLASMIPYSPKFQYGAAVEMSDSDEDIENMLCPQKATKPKSPISHASSPTPDPDLKAPSIDSPGGSVDTVIKSPIKVSKNTPRLATFSNQMSNTDNNEHPRPKTTLDLLNESSESEVILQDKVGPTDSEDEFDFFD